VATIIDSQDLPLDALVIGLGQIRLREVAAGIAELAQSIDKQGLLQPIVVGPADGAGKYEIILGQRRFLAHKELGRATIRAQILDEQVDEIDAKILSLTENLMRRDISRRDKIDVCTALYKKYGTMKDVAQETGLPYNEVRQYVKYDRLQPELKELVDRDEVGLDVALRAQDAASVTEYTAGDAIKLAKEMANMSGAQRDRLARERQDQPTKAVDDVIESAKETTRVTQVVVTLGAQAHQALQQYAKDEGSNQDDAAAGLINEGLQGRGFEL
jgi:ParB family transcriptional regulator, chromosome partitioning protein